MMRMLKSLLWIAPLLIFMTVAEYSYGRPTSEPPQSAARPIASKCRLAAPGSPLYATIGGQERKIADSALAVWLIDQGRSVVYSAADGAGGYENEGQALHLYDTQTGEQRKIMAEYFVVERVRAVKTRTARTALLVKMRDGGLGALHLAVVDPSRGEVFYKEGADVISRRGESIVVGYYRDEDWDRIQHKTKVRPYKTEHFDLSKILEMPVITNEPSSR
jgi:hypothetical protein